MEPRSLFVRKEIHRRSELINPGIIQGLPGTSRASNDPSGPNSHVSSVCIVIKVGATHTVEPLAGASLWSKANVSPHFPPSATGWISLTRFRGACLDVGPSCQPGRPCRHSSLVTSATPQRLQATVPSIKLTMLSLRRIEQYQPVTSFHTMLE